MEAQHCLHTSALEGRGRTGERGKRDVKTEKKTVLVNQLTDVDDSRNSDVIHTLGILGQL